ncbi:MAG: 50S ribosomal protein L17 [Planctomycetota bacterium]|jgi:large subunit ribosomal protein L17
MRHRVAGHRLGRTSQHRLAMRRNMVASLFEHETISTTMEKAKEVKPFAEKLITLAKKGSLAARRRAIAALGDRDILTDEDGRLVRKSTVIGKLFSELGPRYLDRPGGYTRIISLSMKRLGDNGRLVLLQLVGEGEQSVKKQKYRKSAKKAKPEEEVVEVTEEDAVMEEKTETQGEVSDSVVEHAEEKKDAEQSTETDSEEQGQ